MKKSLLPCLKKYARPFLLVFCCLLVLLLSSRRASHATFVSAPTLPTSLGATLNTYRGHSNAVTAVAWSPDGKRIASASYDMTVQVWDAVTGHLYVTYRGHRNWVSAIAWSPDGNRLASAGYDKTVQVWMLGKGSRSDTLLTYHGHFGWVTTLAWSPDGK